MIRRTLPVIAAATLLGACAPDAPLPASPARVRVTMDDFSYRGPASFPSGRVVIHTRNAGKLRHDLVVIQIPENVPPLGEQLQSETRHATETIAVLPPQKPGEETSFALDLEAGRYGMLCFVPDEEGTPHALLGMHKEFSVE